MKETIVRRIEQVLTQDGLSAQAFSQILFCPNGLFNQLASSEDECRAVAQSSLFQQANARLTELQQQELAVLAQAAASRRNAKANGVAAQPVGDGEEAANPVNPARGP
jgi:hypothetical protein